jgi:hypothetical protein
MLTQVSRRGRFWAAGFLVLLVAGLDGGERAGGALIGSGAETAGPGAGAGNVAPQPLLPLKALHVRYEVHKLTAAQIAAWRKGVALMQSRPASDPTSWLYQANIHGYPSSGAVCDVTPGGPQPEWATCQHGNFFFLAWHRMYLYFFERILRAAVQQAAGNPKYEFALPYWDYENSRFQDLPVPFRVPSDSSNPLYVAQRAPNCNRGQACVTAADAGDGQALALTPFCSCPAGAACPGCTAGLQPDESFGGAYAPGPVHSGSGYGELEFQPHNVVHVAVGGSAGWMSFVTCAARDPVFWAHHANIDRLWQVWLNQDGRENPLAAKIWKNQPFTFFTETRQRVTMTGCQILNMATQLDYQYYGVPVRNVVLCSGAGAPPEGIPRATPAAAPKVLAASETAERMLGDGPLTLSVPVPAAAARRMTELAAGQKGRLRLIVDGLKLLHGGASYRVYMNLPEKRQPDPKGPYFVGNIALFGEEGEQAAEGTRSFDITDRVRDLVKRGEWSGKLRLTFVRGNPDPAGGAKRQPQNFIRFSRVSVVER